MPHSRLLTAKLLVVVLAITLFALFMLRAKPTHSLLFLTPIDPCEDSQFICSRGGTKTFGPFIISFPSDFYGEMVNLYCDFRDPSSVPAQPTGLKPAAQPASCYFGQQDGKPVLKFLKPVRVTMRIPPGQVSQVAMYMYRPGG